MVPLIAASKRRLDLSFDAVCSHMAPVFGALPRLRGSGGLLIIVVEHAAQTLPAPEPSAISRMRIIRDNHLVVQTLVFSFAVIMRYKFENALAQ